MINPGNKIKEFRKSFGWTAEELGRLVGLTGASVGRIESGKQAITLQTLHRIAMEFDVPASVLIEEDAQIVFATVIGDTSQGVFSANDVHTIPLPNNRRLENHSPVAFQTPDGFLVCTEHQFARRKDFGAQFIIRTDAGLSVRSLEKHDEKTGFVTSEGDPELRWLDVNDRRILNMWRAVLDMRWLID